jgi:hypothetical protein
MFDTVAQGLQRRRYVDATVGRAEFFFAFLLFFSASFGGSDLTS